MGMWLTTSHPALTPQAPAQGSTHLLFMQAFVKRQSVFRTHSGLQAIQGLPKKPSRQTQLRPLRCSTQSAFEPQRMFSQVSVFSSGPEKK